MVGVTIGPRLYAGQLRWSDRSSGLEFAPLTANTGFDSRRTQRQRPGIVNTDIGLLLQDDLERDGIGEGCGVVVLAFPKRMTDGEILELAAAISEVLAERFLVLK